MDAYCKHTKTVVSDHRKKKKKMYEPYTCTHIPFHTHGLVSQGWTGTCCHPHSSLHHLMSTVKALMRRKKKATNLCIHYSGLNTISGGFTVNMNSPQKNYNHDNLCVQHHMGHTVLMTSRKAVSSVCSGAKFEVRTPLAWSFSS